MVDSIVTTEPEFISLPVAGKVKMVPKGITVDKSLINNFFCKMSIGLPSNFAAADINLVPSITEPPPTARIKSIFCSLTTATAFIKVSKCGFASIPPNSTTSKPFKFSSTCA